MALVEVPLWKKLLVIVGLMACVFLLVLGMAWLDWKSGTRHQRSAESEVNPVTSPPVAVESAVKVAPKADSVQSGSPAAPDTFTPVARPKLDVSKLPANDPRARMAAKMAKMLEAKAAGDSAKPGEKKTDTGTPK